MADCRYVADYTALDNASTVDVVGVENVAVPDVVHNILAVVMREDGFGKRCRCCCCWPENLKLLAIAGNVADSLRLALHERLHSALADPAFFSSLFFPLLQLVLLPALLALLSVLAVLI